ncbi:molybdopterin synthase sulfur carrier subunit [Pseudoxanthomonas daejeonensis]|uniref:Molybdopterin synthase sulfur carrier subunit n=2 Tax=Pseudoxanthomonas daejeonensis TaxID=266062 RepID=A0ABQ6Z3J9_9GAMM|nr:molybdopterin synthase sulfur carrier subunit [Pseudoxanthomonas daejeonensis]
MAKVRLLYFASLREATGQDVEVVDSAAPDLATLYAEAAARHALAWPRERLRVAVDGAFAQWDDALRDGSEVAFIPPVSGG